MEESSLAGSIRRFQVEKTNRYAAIALVVYTAVVYVWALTMYPLGADYAAIAEPATAMHPVPAALFRVEVAVFGSWPLPYRVINVGLLYGCAFVVYLIGRQVIFGPPWLSLLAAVLYMANPIHRDAVFLLSGIDALVPHSVALLAVYFGVRAWRLPNVSAIVLAAMVMSVAILVFPMARWIAIPILVLTVLPHPEQDLPPASSRRWLAIVAAALVVLSLFVHGVGDVAGSAYRPGPMWTPLYLVLYPLGFLPDTLRQFHRTPWLAWLTVALAAAALVLVLRKAKSPALVWAVLSAFAVRFGMGDYHVDLVHLLGGRHLLLANAFVMIGVCALFRAMIRHPKWHRPVVTGTTFICLLLFGMQIHGAFVWRGVGKDVREFQTAVAASQERPVGLLPDVAFIRHAPAFFGASIAYDTPFATAVEAHTLLQLNTHMRGDCELRRESYDPHSATVVVECNDLGYALGAPYTVDARETDTTTLAVTDATATRAVVTVRPKSGVLPSTAVAAPGLTVH